MQFLQGVGSVWSSRVRVVSLQNSPIREASKEKTNPSVCGQDGWFYFMARPPVLFYRLGLLFRISTPQMAIRLSCWFPFKTKHPRKRHTHMGKFVFSWNFREFMALPNEPKTKHDIFWAVLKSRAKGLTFSWLNGNPTTEPTNGTAGNQ